MIEKNMIVTVAHVFYPIDSNTKQRATYKNGKFYPGLFG
jgi:hypothetical protein